jgi:hypothetical protein
VKQKKMQEVYEEIFKIVKNTVEGEQGKQGIVSKLRKQMSLKKVPDHIQKVNIS